MEIVIVDDAEQVARHAADAVVRALRRKPTLVLGLATGSSPVAAYEELARRVQAGELDFSGVQGFALDEYVGLRATHPESYATVIARDVVAPLHMTPSLVHVPDGRGQDLDAAARDFDAAIAASGGIDVQILGIGANGHIGFNEPGSSLRSRTRVKTLAARTRADNARFFDSFEDVPLHCITQGLGTISEARELILVAQGATKAAAVAAAAEGPVTAMCPASVLQLHPRATMILDAKAAADLAHRDYYLHVAANKGRVQEYAGLSDYPPTGLELSAAR
ncbi:glucosamine-6-phosphate deaminase [Agromyces subbeticus]|uniref:glucosamine-6-phosphate deaminase n=1 Tax=Agromyces subbeticus TaxID=293890 RepID=UPI0003B53C0A|nr:glucosamine-6-phosphate deaminase [Agromyces subbeticus]